MNDTVKEWIEKAENDFATAGRELKAEGRPNYDDVCFHAQQCVEKLIKGILIHHHVIPPKIHDLVELTKLLTGTIPLWSWPVEDLRFLSRAAVVYRYPGEGADKEEARQALTIATKIRDRLLLLLPPGP